jgi:hypothetical protein
VTSVYYFSKHKGPFTEEEIKGNRQAIGERERQRGRVERRNKD